ncbi:ATP-binding protein [Natronospirillum operosum]|uniref:ATP-binding protein n=1 Tax=Natronospirillum operosum TaxID=2759953 RepID=A0A4Z0W5F3_9GAMM|nr:ATP-binding protein [Natronospirillum operosum]TGG92097.1 ATP-binding protein [Natronospirillum operosum]
MSDSITFTIEPDWREIDRINNQAREFLAQTLLASSGVDTYTMVLSELMENGIKYGRGNKPIEVSVKVTRRSIRIQVDNYVDAAQLPSLKNLDRTLQWIRGIQDPYQAFLERVRQIAREPLSDGKSCLGLVRIAYEGRADLDFILEDDRLSVSAVASLSPSMCVPETSEGV